MQKLTHAKADADIQTLALQYRDITLSRLGTDAYHHSHGDEQLSANLKIPQDKSLDLSKTEVQTKQTLHP